jgi:hypothetical protein
MENSERIKVQFLKPEDIKIFRGTFNLMHLTDSKGNLYRGVYAVSAFPILCPNRYIFLFYYDEYDNSSEIGVIENIDIFPEEAREIILEVMRKHYFAYVIQKIYSIKLEFGILHFEVETDKGPKNFDMRWTSHRTLDFGESGKVLLDVFDDRYIIPDVNGLSRADRDLFTRYVYW